MKHKNIKKKSINWAFFGIILIGIVAGAMFFDNDHKASIPLPLIEPPVQSFETFIGNWNDKTRAFDLSEQHRLSSIDNQKMLKQLYGYMDRFSMPIAAKEADELSSIVKKYPHSIWNFYRQFLVSYTGKGDALKEDWKGLLSSDDLRQRIQKVTSNRDYDESIKLLLASSDPCAFFAIYKYDLYKKGLSKNFKTCNAKIVDAVKYPSLAMLIR